MRVLLTGDSHMEWSPFGVQLEKLLRDAGATVTRMAIGGSSARQWASGKDVCRTMNGSKLCYSAADLRAAGPFDLVVVSLGTNDAANASAAGADRTRAAEKAADDIETFMRLVGASRFVVVGPPKMRNSIAHYTDANMAPLVDVFARRFSNGFIDSRVVQKVDGDAVHFGRQGGAAWAQLVFDRIGGTRGASAGTAGTDSTPLVALAVVSVLAVLWWRNR